MFKISSFEQELMKEMQSRLVANQAENEYSFNKLAKAADYLNTAAELFDDVGMNKEAESVTRILEKIADDGETLEEFKPLPADTSVMETEEPPVRIVDTILKMLKSPFLTLERLEEIEVALHDRIRHLGGLPMGEKVLETEVEEIPTFPKLYPDVSDLRTSKKKL